MYTILGEAPEGYNILLAHNPNYFPVYASWGADVTFCGHIHGGMVWLPVYQIEDKTMILSRGLGRGRMGIRLFNPPELVCVTLTREE